MSPTSADNSHLCPLCEQPNRCAISAGEPAEHCWCMTATIAAGAIERATALGEAGRCLCPRCAQPLEQGDRHAG